MERIFNSVALVILLMGTGYVFSKKGILGKESNNLFSKLLINLSVPASVIQGLTSRFEIDELIQSGKWLALSFTIIISFAVIGRILSFLNFIKRKKLFEMSFIFSNVIFIGLPINIALFGEECIPYVFLYFFIHAFFFWTYGIYCASGGGNIKEGLKNLINPSTIAFVIGILMVIFRVNIPEFLSQYMKFLGGMTTPLAMLYLGTAIYSLGVWSIKPDFEGVFSLIGRQLIAPLVAIFILKFSGGFMDLPILLKKVYLIMASMPIMTNVAIFSGYYNNYPEEASKIVGLSTILVILTVPLYAVLGEIIF